MARPRRESTHDLSLEALASRLEARRPRRIRLGRVLVQAAVAVVLRPSPGGRSPDVLVVQRAERDGDPWSGHISFPGGRRQSEDADLRATAERELEEETGLAIRAAGISLPSGLGDVVTRAHEKPVPMLVRPFLFGLEKSPRRWRLSHEVSERLWIPLEFLADSANRVAMTWRFAGADWELPSYLFEGRRIWGLTLLILDELLYVSHGARFPRLPGLTPLERLWRRRHVL